MRLVTSDPDPIQWDDAVRAAGGSVFHARAWARYVVAAETTAVPQFIRLESDAGETLGYALGFRAQSRRPLLRALTGRFWLDSPPVTRDAPMMDAFLHLLEKASRDAGAVALEVGSYGTTDGSPALETRGYATRARFEFVISLERTPDDLWRAIDPQRRSSIRRGGRCGVAVEELSPDTGVGILRRLQDASIERIADRGGRVERYTGDPAADPVRVLIETGVGRIIGARVRDEWVSASLMTCFNSRVYQTLAGHTRRGLETQAPSVLLWECMQWYRSRGAREFNLGGCSAEALDERSPEHGVYQYKKDFGGTRVRCVSGTKVLRPVRLRINEALHAVRDGLGA